MSGAARESAFSWIVRGLFLILAVGVLSLAVGEPPASMDEAQLRDRTLLLAGFGLLAFGMAVPWRLLSRGRMPPPPGRNLAFLSKLVGWSAPLLVLLALGPAPAWLALAGLFALVSAVALWMGKPWAAYPWYAIACGVFVMAALQVVRAFGGESVAAGDEPFQQGYAVGNALGRIVGPVIWTLLGVFLLLEVRLWQRGSRGEGPPPQSR